MLKKFLTYINEKDLFDPAGKVLLAVSGGMDSVVMLHLFHKAKFDFAVAHCNFGLRGEEADEDALFVKKLAKKYKAPYHGEQFDTQGFADQEKISVQMAARVLRYEWFAHLCRTHGFARIATAHHLNDTLETVLFNLTKGTGIAGLHGIQPKNGQVVRPLLFADKEEIYAYVVENQLAWREDSSNQSSHYHRNLLRNEVIPLLKTINPNLAHTMQSTVERVTAVEAIFLAETDRLRRQVLREQDGVQYLDFQPLAAEVEPLVKLYQLLRPYHFSYAQVRDIYDTLPAEPGRQFDSPTHRLVKDRTALVITPKGLHAYLPATIAEGDARFRNETLALALQTVPAADYTLSPSPKIAALDGALLQFPLKVRVWKAGDKFCPLGMKQKKKVSDYLIDEKVPVNIKQNTHVLLSGDDIIWVVGRRIDDRFKLTDKTERVFEARME